MIKPAVLDAMVDAGCTPAQIAAAVKADQASSTGAARQARFRAKQKALLSDESDVTAVTVTDKVSPKKEIPPTPPKEKTTPSNSLSVVSREFDEFWSLFPNKVGKRDAERAFSGARSRAPLETILDGLRRYADKRDDRPWCNPATFLNQDRWADQPATPPPKQPSTASPPVSDFNRVLDSFQGKNNAPHTGPSVDASYSRTDGGSASNLVQLNALPSRR